MADQQSSRMSASTNGGRREGANGGGFTLPGLSSEQGQQVARLLQQRLVALIDLDLTLKHIHWNVVGPGFIGVHKMLDPQVDGVREMIDDIAERIAALGTSPNGLPGNVVASRTWDDYSLTRATVPEHLGALDIVYAGVIGDHRACIAELQDRDLVSQDMIVSQTGTLERYQWFVRAHLESSGGHLSTESAEGEEQAAQQAKEGYAEARSGA